MNPICPDIFYGNKIQKRKRKSDICWIKIHRVMPSRILAPTKFWKEFSKQVDALATAAENSTEADTLCTFVYEKPSDGRRKFVVAHPEVYWWYYKIKPQDQRCSYEVIPKDSPCWLYLDLEYQIELNPLCNGLHMTETLVDIIRAYLLNYYHFLCDRNNVLILDSTSDTKFSRHAIFTTKDMAFKDNSHVGRLIKTIYNDIMMYLKSEIQSHKILSRFNKADIEALLVETDKHGKKLFIDCGVYTKNRHFRIYLSTKWGKQSYLIVSADCVHTPVNVCKEKELGIFLDSLVSYFPNKKDLILLEFLNENDTKVQLCSKGLTRYVRNNDENDRLSPYPEIDKYIRTIVDPGKIRISRYCDRTKTLRYEIYGNRYCENIGRCHKSNNIYWIVDLVKKKMYQKCHDEDCLDFLSAPKSLPEEIVFKLDTEGDNLVSRVPIDVDIA